MWQKLFRFMGVSETTASFVDYAIKLLIWLGIIGGGGVMGVSVYASALYETYGIVAVAGGTMAGALAVAIALRAAASAFKVYSEGIALRRIEQRPIPFNPKINHYIDSVFRVQDMFHPIGSPVLEGKTFENCDIIGPAVLSFMENAHLNRNSFFECGDIILVNAGINAVGVLGFRDCTFRRCRFFRTGIVTADLRVLEAFIAQGARDPRIVRPAARQPREDQQV